jgi:outer membrane protein OmpA-like peptidoglycan-associated protein
MATAAQSYGQQANNQAASLSGNKQERNYSPSEISIWGAGGLSILNYDPEAGNRSNMLGGAFGIGYSYYWSEHFGLLLGAELALYQSKFKTNGLRDNYNTVDLDTYNNIENINFRYRLNDYEELQRLWNINIPLMLQYQTPLWASNRFYAGLGFKLGIPVKSTSKTSDFKITSMGFYYDENTGSKQVLNDVTELGFGEFSNKSVKNDLNFGFSYIGTVETGIKWNLGGNVDLYTGLYFDYAFNNIVKGSRHKHLVEYASFDGNNFNTVNSVLVSQHAQINNLRTDALPESTAKSMTTHVSPVAFGLKLRLGIGTCSRNKSVKKDYTSENFSNTKKQLIRPEDEIRSEELEITVVELEPREEFGRAFTQYGSSLRWAINTGSGSDGYELDQSTLTPLMESMLDDKITQIRKTYGDNISIVCEGHTCNIGSEAYNMELGKKRAEEVREFLIDRGFSPDKVTTTSRGLYLPVVPNTDDANRKKNRRVMLIVRD